MGKLRIELKITKMAATGGAGPDVDLPGLEDKAGPDSEPVSERPPNTLLLSSWVTAESRSGRVELRKWSSGVGPDLETIEAVISFMYTGSVRISPGNVHEVLELAN
ncbi:hypothetical protein L345_11459, partial [Ophiophagus hannah]